jgi:hypothetical protein
MGDKTFLAFQQRLNAIVDRRDSGMAKMIDSLLKERSPTNRYFFAVGYSKKTILFLILLN